MSPFLNSIVPLLACAALLIGTTVVWAPILKARWLYVVTSLLALLGLERIARFCVDMLMSPRSERALLDAYAAATNVETVSAIEGVLRVQATAVTAIVVVVGFAVLLWLREALRRPTRTLL